MSTKTFKLRIESPFDFEAASVALAKIQEGVGELAALAREKAGKKASPPLRKGRVPCNRVKAAL
jgi:hypothetical protein